MRKIFLSLALALSPFTVAGVATGCAQLEAVKPRDARAAYAEAEVMLIGAINAVDALAARGFLSQEQINNSAATLTKTALLLNDAYTLLKAGESVRALAKIDFAKPDLERLALTLSMVAEAAAKATPSVWSPPSI